MIVLETERLRLRHLSPADAAFIRELVNDPAFLRYIGDKGVSNNADAVAYIQNGPMASYQRFGFGLYAVELKDTREPIGICGLLKRDSLPDADVGFAFLPSYRAQGYAFESASAVLSHARNVLGLKRVLAITTPDNTGSIRVLEKIGMHFERMISITEGDPELKLFALDL
ncbi:MAG TPA: GNAT family N-acetyltransferase [Pyrinomonadaceae bacterium]|nr:GNAT family N-acetyltransferase [Pyrinomonadaceae bacterium]